MSSHHFVREGQEPAVIIAGSNIHAELLGSVLEWSPKVITVGAASACLLIADAIKADDCHLLKGEDPPAFPYEVDLYFNEAAAEEEIIWEWMRINHLPFYLFGWQDERIIAFIRSLTREQAHLITAISIDKKWIYPGKGAFSKWMKKGTQLELTGQSSDWEIRGRVEISWPKVLILEDGLQMLATNQLEIFAEPLYL